MANAEIDSCTTATSARYDFQRDTAGNCSEVHARRHLYTMSVDVTRDTLSRKSGGGSGEDYRAIDLTSATKGSKLC